MSATSVIRAGLAAVLFLAACGTNPQGGHAGATPAPGIASDRVAAIEAQVAAAENPDVGFVVFADVSDQARDGIPRSVQLAGGAYHIEVLCDVPHHQCEDAATQSLIRQLGFTPHPQYPGDYQKDSPHATTHEQALLTERLFLQVLKASPDYQLTYYNNVQTRPAPLPTPRR